jgi:DNA-binding NarL/FixJ family response regulator
LRTLGRVTSTGLATARHFPTPPAKLFGREAELQAVSAWIDGIRSAAGSLVISGEAGMGKTALLRAGVALAAGRGWTVLRATPARGDMRLAFAGLADLIESRLPELVDELPPPQARALREALLLEEAPAYPADPRAIASGLRTALTILARRAPVLLVIDDVQWLDPASAAAVSFVLRRLAAEPVGLLCSQRAERARADVPLGLSRAHGHVQVLSLGGLSLGALHRLLRTRLGTSFSHPTLRRIAMQSGGNPFIALEIGMALVRLGIVTTHGSALPLPQSLSALMEDRLSALGPQVRDALAVVAVLPDAPADMHIAAGADPAALDQAVLAGVLEADAIRLRFTHPLLAAAVVDAIPPGRKRELHAAAARIVRLPEERARHQALGASGRSAQVAAALDAAARAAATRGAPATAAELHGLAAASTPDDQPARAGARRLDMARQLALAGETHAAAALLERLIASAQAGMERSDALIEYGKLRQDDLAAAEKLFEQALAEAGGDRTRTAGIRSALSQLWLMRGDSAQALAQARCALNDAEAAGSPALLAAVLARNFDLSLLNGDPADERMLARALELDRLAPVPPSETPPSLLAGLWHLHRGSLDLAEQELRQVLTRAEADGVQYWRAEALLRLSKVAEKRGEASKAAALAAESLDLAEQLERPHLTCAALHGRASAALLLGNAAEARELAARGAALAQESGDAPHVLIHTALLGSVDLALGEYPAAASRLKAIIPALHVLGVRPITQAIWADAVEALVAVAEFDLAATVTAALADTAREPATAALAARCRGILAAVRGDSDAAIAELADALSLSAQVCDMPLERARTLIALGSAQRRFKQRGSARASLTEAVAILDRIPAPLWAARARAELGRISGRAPAPEDLTVAERRVAELVLRGLSNREVAAELFVTVRAVESTLTKTYTKLAVRSRSELTARLRSGAADYSG